MRSAVRLLSPAFLAFLAACGSTTDGDEQDDGCDALVAEARACLDRYCSTTSNQLCTCAGDGLDMDQSCNCTGNVDASLRAVCDGSGSFSCDTFRASLEAVADRGRCEACTVDDDCWDPDTSRICTAGTCVEGCAEDSDCFRGTLGRICLSQSCVEGCREDIECFESDRSRVCRANECVDGCREDSDCFVPGGPSRICYGDTECRDGCREDFDCPPPLVCLGLICRAG